MTKFCIECGFENQDDANFCANCGMNIDYDSHNSANNNSIVESNNNYQLSLQVPQKYEDYDIIEELQCFNCNQHTFIQLNKKSLLSNKVVYYCTNCGMAFEKQGNGFKLVDISDKSNRMWELYNSKTLTGLEWERIANGGLSDKDQAERDKQLAIEKQKELELHRKEDLEIVVQKLANGKINLTPVSSPVILKKNETAYISLPNITLSEPRAVRVSKSGGYGTSYRLAKGFTVHSGTGQSRSVSHDEIMAIDIGTFVITNKRVVFVGSKKSVNIDLKKILSMTVYKDGISIQRENKQKIEYFTKTNRHSMDFTIDGRTHSLPLEGYFIKAIILGQIANL